MLHSFRSSVNNDGSLPNDLINVGGVLYGTTEFGGAFNNGTVFKITTAGVETVLHAFRGRSVRSADGALPNKGLIDVGGTLYGTTGGGGSGNCDHGCGTVFKITTAGAENVLYSFNDEGMDAGLIEVNGTLYGTTNLGGSGNCKHGCGTVFKLTTAGALAKRLPRTIVGRGTF